MELKTGSIEISLAPHQVLLNFDNDCDAEDFLKFWECWGKGEFDNRKFNEDGEYDPESEYED